MVNVAVERDGHTNGHDVLLNQEAAYPAAEFQRVFPDVDPRTFFVKAPEAVKASPLYNRVVSFVFEDDQRVQAQAEKGVVDKKYFTIVMGTEELIKKQKRHVQIVRELIQAELHDKDRVVMIAPLAGAASPMYELAKQGVDTKKMFAVNMSGSSAASSGYTRAESLPEEALRRSNQLVVIEDIMDTGDTLLEILQQRSEASGLVFDGDFHALREENRRLHDQWIPFSDEQYEPIYDQIPQWMEKAGVVMTAFISKNKPLKDKLLDYVKKAVQKSTGKNSRNTWAIRQWMALDAMEDMDPNTWITGGMGDYKYGYFDMGIKGKDMLPHMKEYVSPEEYEEFVRQGFEEMTLRLNAHVGPMMGHFYEGENTKNYIKDKAKDLAVHLTSSQQVTASS